MKLFRDPPRNSFATQFWVMTYGWYIPICRGRHFGQRLKQVKLHDLQVLDLFRTVLPMSTANLER